MRLMVACCSLSLALALSGCSSGDAANDQRRGAGPAPDLPSSVGNGAGSEHGNYLARSEGEMLGPSGERCVVFNWDRPLTRDLAVRLTSASCESHDRPGLMVCREISRTVIPIAESSLNGAQDEAP